MHVESNLDSREFTRMCERAQCTCAHARILHDVCHGVHHSTTGHVSFVKPRAHMHKIDACACVRARAHMLHCASAHMCTHDALNDAHVSMCEFT